MYVYMDAYIYIMYVCMYVCMNMGTDPNSARFPCVCIHL